MSSQMECHCPIKRVKLVWSSHVLLANRWTAINVLSWGEGMQILKEMCIMYMRILIKKWNAILFLQIFVSVVYIGRNWV